MWVCALKKNRIWQLHHWTCCLRAAGHNFGTSHWTYVTECHVCRGLLLVSKSNQSFLHYSSGTQLPLEPSYNGELRLCSHPISLWTTGFWSYVWFHLLETCRWGPEHRQCVIPGQLLPACVFVFLSWTSLWNMVSSLFTILITCLHTFIFPHSFLWEDVLAEAAITKISNWMT